jgi:hypothetical protein
MISQQNVLSWATFFPLIGLAVILLFTAARFFLGMSRHTLDQLARITGLAASGLSMGCAILAWVWFDPAKSGVQMMQHFTWIKTFNIEYLMGVDGLSISMVLLTGLISFVAFIASMPWWGSAKYSEMAGMTEHGHGEDAGHHPKHFSVRMVPGYMCMLLLLQTGMMGTFVALDMFLFYVFWEVMLLPMYFLIGIWGGPRKEYAAIKFFLYTLVGSVLMLLAIIGIYYNSHAAPLADGTMSSGHTLNLLALAAQGKQGVFAHSAAIFGFAFSKIAFIALFIGFAIKIPMFPFHTWLPDAHVEAPTPVSVILAGVLLKMGPYGILRFNYPLLPDATNVGGQRHRPVRRDQHHLRRLRVPGAKRSQEAHRLLLGQPHGLHPARHGGHDPGRDLRRRVQHVLPRHHLAHVVPYRGRDLRPRPPPRDWPLRRIGRGHARVHGHHRPGLLRLARSARHVRLRCRVPGALGLVPDLHALHRHLGHRGHPHRGLLSVGHSPRLPGQAESHLQGLPRPGLARAHGALSRSVPSPSCLASIRRPFCR